MAIAQNPDPTDAAGTTSLHTERRIAVLTLIFGLAASLAAAAANHRDWAAGLILGAALAWINFRLLRRGLDALVTASTAQASVTKPRVPMTTYFGALFRYALIALAVYVIFKFLKVPLASLVVGLCSLAVAALAASVYELIRPGK